MSLENVALRKLLQLMYLRENLRTTRLKAEARTELARRAGHTSGGGHFHVPFWADAKAHAGGHRDLTEATDEQIAKNWRRKNLYPRLHDGFLRWWNENRRWINEDINELPNTIRASYDFADIRGVVRVDNLLALRVGDDGLRLIYPYFSDRPYLSEEAARLGLWVMSKALSDHKIDDMRILDVIRGATFSVDRHALTGGEEGIFRARYAAILEEWRYWIEAL